MRCGRTRDRPRCLSRNPHLFEHGFGQAHLLRRGKRQVNSRDVYPGDPNTMHLVPWSRFVLPTAEGFAKKAKTLTTDETDNTDLH